MIGPKDQLKVHFRVLVSFLLLLNASIWPASPEALSQLSLADLMNMNVTSVSKKPENMNDLAASVYVLSEEDIRRSGATRFTELLALVPGAIVHDMNYNNSTSTIRSEEYVDPQTVLILLDGVPIISKISGGFVAPAFEIPLEMIERIEVIKGPGGTIYGANAVTGVISIYTKKGEQSEGLQLSLGGGLQDYLSPHIRYGRLFSDNLYLTLYGMFKTTRGFDKTKGKNYNADGRPVNIDSLYADDDIADRRAFSGGASLVHNISERAKIKSNLFFANVSYKDYIKPLGAAKPYVTDYESTDFFVSERFDYEFSPSHEAFFHGYFRYLNYQYPLHGNLENKQILGEFEVQDNVTLFSRHALSIGANIRMVNYDLSEHSNDNAIAYIDPQITKMLYAAFLQNKIAVLKNVDLTLGAKAEVWTLISNTPEFSPSARLSLRPLPFLTLWAASSRAITIPGYTQRNLEQALFPGPPQAALPGTDRTYMTIISGGDDLVPTEYFIHEGGIKTNLIPKASLNVSAYYSLFNNFIIAESKDGPPYVSEVFDNVTSIPFMAYSNQFQGKLWGGEAVIKYFPLTNLKLEASYSHLDGYYKKEGEKKEFEAERISPQHITRLRSYIDFPSIESSMTVNFGWHSEYMLHLVGSVKEYSDPLALLDVTAEKRLFNDKISLQIWGRNLLNGEPYFERYGYPTVPYGTKVHRTFGGNISWSLL